MKAAGRNKPPRRRRLLHERGGRWGWPLSVAVTLAGVAVPLLAAGYLWELHDYGLDNLDPRRDAVGTAGLIVWLAPLASAVLPFCVRSPLLVPAAAATGTLGTLWLMAWWEDGFRASEGCMDMCPMPRLGMAFVGVLSFIVALVATVATWGWEAWQRRSEPKEGRPGL